MVRWFRREQEEKPKIYSDGAKALLGLNFAYNETKDAESKGTNLGNRNALKRYYDALIRDADTVFDVLERSLRENSISDGIYYWVREQVVNNIAIQGLGGQRREVPEIKINLSDIDYEQFASYTFMTKDAKRAEDKGFIRVERISENNPQYESKIESNLEKIRALYDGIIPLDQFTADATARWLGTKERDTLYDAFKLEKRFPSDRGRQERTEPQNDNRYNNVVLLDLLTSEIDRLEENNKVKFATEDINRRTGRDPDYYSKLDRNLKVLARRMGHIVPYGNNTEFIYETAARYATTRDRNTVINATKDVAEDMMVRSLVAQALSD